MPVTVTGRRQRAPRRTRGPRAWGALVPAAVLCAVGALVYSDIGNAPEARHTPAPQQESLPPPGWVVKGNISVSTGERLYHVPGMRDYATTVIDTSRGERWFRTEADAAAAGWRRADAPRGPRAAP